MASAITPEDDWEIAALTFNLNGQKPYRSIIKEWLDNEERFTQCKIIAVTLQEVSHSEMFSSVSGTENWTDALNEWFFLREFVMVGQVSLASNLLLVYCLPLLLHLIARLDSKWTCTSFAGHKGTISCRLLFKDGLSLVFLGSHFVHGEENLDVRIRQFQNSLQCTFDNEEQQSYTELQRNNSIRQFVFWMGDLNFRIQGYNDTHESLISTLTKITSPKPTSHFNKRVANLIEQYDQLTRCRSTGKIFKDFQEPIITFLPTYRILVGNGEYDPLRMPSWCDRILYKTSLNAADQLDVLRYSSSRRITVSDHFPVSAVFRIHRRAGPQQCEVSKLSTRRESTDKKSKLEHRTANRHTTAGWPCVFLHIPTWAPTIPLVCRFRVDGLFWRVAGSYRDWLGVYPPNVGNVAKPLHWIYLLTCYNDDESNLSVADSPRSNPSSSPIDETQCSSPSLFSSASGTLSVAEPACCSISTQQVTSVMKMVGEFPALPVGRYRIGYFSVQRNCLQEYKSLPNCTRR